MSGYYYRDSLKLFIKAEKYDFHIEFRCVSFLDFIIEQNQIHSNQGCVWSNGLYLKTVRSSRVSWGLQALTIVLSKILVR